MRDSSMMGKRKRGMVRTGTAALGGALIALALVVNPVGATPFTGQETAQFWFSTAATDSNGDGIPGTQFLSSGYSTLAGAGQCSSFIEYQLAPAPSGNCDGVEFSAVPGGWAACQTEDGDGVVWMQVVDATTCLPLSCYDADNNIVVGCTATGRTELNILGGTGMYAGATGSYTATGTSTYTTTVSGTSSLDTAGDITLVGGAPPDDVVLEIPSSGTNVSGISLISGWSCLGGELEVEFSDVGGAIETMTVAHGSTRLDTEARCGDIDNGFSITYNWSRLGSGEKTARLIRNGEEVGSATFMVTAFDTEFVTGVSGMCTIADFPTAGQNATFVWQQGHQGLVLESLN